jgi:hypothetical protein
MPTCGWCGAALAGPEHGTVGVQQADRRVFGVPPATGLLVLGTILVALGVFLVFTGRAAVGLLALAVGLLVFAGFPSLARRPDESPVARRAVRSYDGLRERADATIESLAARAATRRRLSRIDGEVEELERARANGLRELGEAAYARADDTVERLRGEIATVDTALEAKGAEREQLLAETEERVEEARLRAQPTERLEREDEARTEITQRNEAPAEDDAARRAS